MRRENELDTLRARKSERVRGSPEHKREREKRGREKTRRGPRKKRRRGERARV